MTNVRQFDVHKQRRRDNLNVLYERYGQAELERLTGISAAYLFQMAQGAGKQRRGVSDTNANKITDGVGLPRGWLDLPHSTLEAVEEMAQADLAVPKAAPEAASQPVQQQALSVALRLYDEELAGKELPYDKRAELLILMSEMLAEGLPEAKVLRFVRATS